MKRAILMGGVLVVTLIGIGVYVLYSSLDTIVKSAVEQVGSDATGTKVTLGDVDISPTSGTGALRQFRMTNPKGFGEGDAFKFEEVRVTIDLSTIASDPVVINEIVIQAPEITYTIGGGTSNMDEIQKNVDDYAASEEGAGGVSSESRERLGSEIVAPELRKYALVDPVHGDDVRRRLARGHQQLHRHGFRNLRKVPDLVRLRIRDHT